jgi:PPOX class probable F420-dependent enzyme
MAFSDRSLITQVTDRLYLRMRHRDAWSSATAEPTAPERGFELLRGRKYCLLTTFRRTGEPVPTPVWFGLDGDRLYFHSEATVGKVKRIRANPSVRVAPCDARGKPLGAPAEGTARVLPSEQEAHAERAIAANYGVGRKVYERVGERIGVGMVYVEVTPSPAAGASGDSPAQGPAGLRG